MKFSFSKIFRQNKTKKGRKLDFKIYKNNTFLLFLKMTLKASFFQETTKKWRHSYLSVQNACIRITERPNKLTGPCDTDDSGPSIVDSRKVFFEAKIEECLVYYGLYEASTASTSSTSGIESNNHHHQSLVPPPIDKPILTLVSNRFAKVKTVNYKVYSYQR